jgi:hypothetical protein
MQRMLSDLRFETLGYFASSKEDWEFYVRPPQIALREIMVNKPALIPEAKPFLDGFVTEFEAAPEHWNDVVWVTKPR